MKILKPITFALLGLSCITLLPVSASAEMKVAIIDLQKVFKDYKKTKKADTELKDKAAGYRKERDERREDYRKMIDQYRALEESADDPSLSEAAREEKKKKLKEKKTALIEKERKLREFDQTTAKLFQDQQLRMRKTIVEEINEMVQEFAKGKYQLVLDKSGMTMNGTPLVFFSEGVSDITAEITKKLNEKK